MCCKIASDFLFVFNILLSPFFLCYPAVAKGETSEGLAQWNRLPTSKVFLRFPLGPQDISLSNYSAVSVEVSDIPANIAYILAQIHVQNESSVAMWISHSFDADDQLSEYVLGSHAGLVVNLAPLQKTARFKIYNPNDHGIALLAIFTGNTDEYPIPGGCNMELKTREAPYLLVDHSDSVDKIHIPLAMLGHRRGVPGSCDLSYNALTYEIYASVMDQRSRKWIDTKDTLASLANQSADFSTITPSLTLLHTNPVEPRTLLKVVRPQHRNVFYVIRVYPFDMPHLASVYVPTISMMNKGDIGTQMVQWNFVCLAAIVGIWLSTMGHKHFDLAVIVYGGLTAAMLTYILLVRFTDPSLIVTVSFTSGLSIIGGFLWYAGWCLHGSSTVVTLLPGLLLGFLIASIEYYSPLFRLEQFNSESTVWLCVLCMMFLVPVFLLSYAKFFHILCCSVIGTLGILLVLDQILGAMITYMVGGLIIRASNPQASSSIVYAPFQETDIYLCVMWVMAIVLTYVIQVHNTHYYSAFPPPGRYISGWRVFHTDGSQVTVVTVSTSGSGSVAGERTPLMTSSTNSAAYGSK